MWNTCAHALHVLVGIHYKQCIGHGLIQSLLDLHEHAYVGYLISRVHRDNYTYVFFVVAVTTVLMPVLLFYNPDLSHLYSLEDEMNRTSQDTEEGSDSEVGVAYYMYMIKINEPQPLG